MSTITSVEPVQVDVRPDYDCGGVLIEAVDRDGNGFSTIFDHQAALELVLRVVGALARLRGWGAAP